ncbi:unnamed protein product [Cuscuta campestris]|uniref:Protein kinase domain-containing protein n=1 Tax=Cuscuta campestris TaxID=132261 RepID=A0A484K9P7_9ASTE|nr:unnamed protein product [Cuscuta campestris]
MAKGFKLTEFIVLLVLSSSSSLGLSEEEEKEKGISYLEVQTLLRVRSLLNSPPSLRNWNNRTDFCNVEPTPSLTLVCYGGAITQLHIINSGGSLRLPENFSVDSLVASLVRLSGLKVLKLVSLGLFGPLPGKIARLSSLEILDLSSNFFSGPIPRRISSLSRLQTLVLDGNGFAGSLHEGLGSLPDLAVLSLKNNSLGGALPETLGDLRNLRVLALSGNNFTGNLPDFTGLENLQVLDLEGNSFGPEFPQLGTKIVTLVLRRNNFSSNIPEKVGSFPQLRHLDVSSNRLVGPFPPSLLSLPLINYLSVAENRLKGMLFENLTCSSELHFVDLSTNLLTGRLPSCLLNSSKTAVVDGNCLEDGDGNQHPVSFCRNEALAVGFLPPSHHRSSRKIGSGVILESIVFGSVIGGGSVVLAMGFFVARRFLAMKRTPSTLMLDNPSSVYTSKLFSDARYMTQAMNIGSVSVPSYRTFSLEELETATNHFDTSTLMGECSNVQIYRGRLRDSSFVAIRCLTLRRSDSIQNFMQRVELISKLRHQHLVSALGHCFECYSDDSSVSRIVLVFEYVPNGTLRSWISGKHGRRILNWGQRVSAAIGVAKGIQFLHTGVVPGVFPNKLKITDILLDQELVAKISTFNLPIFADDVAQATRPNFPGGSNQLNGARERNNGKLDVYAFGVILLELITGRKTNTKKEVKILKDQLQASPTADDAWTTNVVDPRVKSSSSDESVRTMVEICYRCLVEDHEDRPSFEDILWNLQFAAQVQDACRADGSPSSSDASPVSPFRHPSLRQISVR